MGEDGEANLINLCQPKEVFKDRWEVISKLGAGGFGQIYLAKDRLLNCNVALKVESCLDMEKAQLPIELQVMKKYQKNPHAIILYGSGTKEEINFIAMQLIGPNLASLRKKSPSEPKRFSVGTTSLLGHACLEAIRDLHNVNVIHRDIKPSNFAMGLPESPQKNIVYILDFGLARFHTDADGKIRPARNQAGFRGTMRYASLASHLRQDLGRKDDIVSLFYMLFEFWKGTLPWTDQHKHAEVAESKKIHSLDKMATILHPHMTRFAVHLNNLTYIDKPDYSALLTVLTDISTEKNVTSKDPWDWENHFARLIKDEKSKK